MLPALLPPKQDLGVAYDSAFAFDTSTHDKVVSGLPRKRPAGIEPHKLTREPAQPQCSNPLTVRSTSASTTPQTADFTALALALCSCLCGTKIPVLVLHFLCLSYRRHIQQRGTVPHPQLAAEPTTSTIINQESHAQNSSPRLHGKEASKSIVMRGDLHPFPLCVFCFTHLKRASQLPVVPSRHSSATALAQKASTTPAFHVSPSTWAARGSPFLG